MDKKASAATHLISAYWLECDDSFGYYDDSDHGMGKHLLSVMQHAEMSNCICFLTRDYGGIHLGYRRFEIVTELADDIYEQVQQHTKPTGLPILDRSLPEGTEIDFYSKLHDLGKHIEDCTQEYTTRMDLLASGEEEEDSQMSDSRTETQSSECDDNPFIEVRSKGKIRRGIRRSKDNRIRGGGFYSGSEDNVHDQSHFDDRDLRGKKGRG